jgi:hypothetical protein
MSSALWMSGRIEGLDAFREAIRLALTEAADAGFQEMFWCDPDFSDWPLGERAVVEALDRWGRSGRRLRLLAGDWGLVRARDARFVRWRATWAHLIEARALGGGRASTLPSLLWSSDGAVERLDPVRSTGRWVAEPSERRMLRERLEECWRRSSVAFPATTLGL